MDRSFWVEAWREGRTRFHRSEVNDDLKKFLPQFLPLDKVFVPLCGKSLDLLYLRNSGASEVLGVELSTQAIEEFQRENDLSFTTSQIESFIQHRAERLSILEGDLFDLRPESHLKGISFIYDRASLVALTPEQRQHYYQLLKSLDSKLEILLISFEYDQAKVDGPPFSVTSDEITRSLNAQFTITELDRRQVEDLNPKFVEAGLKDFYRVVYRLSRKI